MPETQTKLEQTDKPQVKNQGVAIVDSYSDGYWLMLPNGVVNRYQSKKAVEGAVRSWAKKNSDKTKINVCQIEWR